VRILCPIIGGSGVEVYHQRLATGLAGSGIEMQIFRFSPRFEYLPWLLNWNARWMPPLSWGADLLHTNAEYGCYFRKKHIPWVVTLHHCSIDDQYGTFVSPCSRLHHRLFLRPSTKKSLSMADQVVAVSEYTRRAVTNVLQGDLPIRVIHNGIDPEVFAPRESFSFERKGRVVLFFSGNPTPRKGFDLLAPVMRRLGDDFELRFTAGLRRGRPHRDFPPNMRSLGTLSEQEMVREINGADIVLQPSRREGFGYSILEGMACGKPIVSSNGSSIPELVQHGKGGYLCAVGSVDQLVEAIQDLGQSAEKRKVMGEYNRRQVLSRFTLQQMSEQYAALYRDLLGNYERHRN
jgi:glycosyltransferase involved in cell wall biosynthesis